MCTMVGSGAPAPRKKLGDQLDRILRGGKANARGRLSVSRSKSLERQRKMRAALVVGHGMDFIDDHRLDRLQNFAALCAVRRM